MAIGVTFFIVAALAITIWVVLEFKRLKHKLLAIFLIALIVFTYISFTASIKNQDIDMKTIPGMIEAGKLYMSWLSGVFGNFKTITAYALKQDWKKTDDTLFNKTTEKEENAIWDKL